MNIIGAIRNKETGELITPLSDPHIGFKDEFDNALEGVRRGTHEWVHDVAVLNSSGHVFDGEELVERKILVPKIHTPTESN